MGLLSGLYKPEVNEYIAAKAAGAAERLFDVDSPQAAPFLRFQPIYAVTFPSGNAQEAERTV